MASMISTPIASPSFSSSSASAAPRWIHEVFLSFYGKDTRKTFTDHLYTALKEKGILAFRDDEELERGEYVSKGLLKAIQESMYAVVVISRNYAYYRWCLIELAEIVKCKKKIGLTVYPVFYHVDPSEVRNLTGSFAEAFAKHEGDSRVDAEMMQSWRAALTEVGNISGWDLQDRYEAIVIRDIIGRIFCELNSIFVSVYHNFVGIDSRVEEMMNLLNMGLDDVYFIGVYGMSGVGKTTLTEVVCERVSYQFEASCFIASIRERSTNHGLLLLQKQLLSKIMKQNTNIWDDREGLRVIRNRLRSRKVFIVLDDVDKDEQLEALAGSHDWFGPGSRIIITSKDTQLLERYADNFYKVEVLNDDDALQLFSLSAFKELYPENGYVDLSKDFVHYAQGLPLALKVLGSSLFGRGMVAWKGSWNQLQGIPNREILDVLQKGFDGLEDLQKKLFLDLACFFKGKKLDDIFDILESFGFFPNINIEVLVEKSLITISSERLINMHDLIQKMGQENVRRESPEEPGRRSRLWCYKDSLRVLKDNSGTDAVEGIVLKLPIRVEERLSVKAFSQMKRLRILKIGGITITENFSELSNKLNNIVEWDEDDLESMPTKELRLMKWFEFPFKSLPMNFKPDNLVELNMRGSSIEQLWKGIKSLGNLKRLDLSDSHNLMETPDFSKASKLEMIDLEGCKSLSKVHPSIAVLKQLKLLDFSSCKRLKRLPDKINLESLEDLNLSGCSRLETFPDVENMKSLRLLYLDGTAIKELPSTFVNLSGLCTLSVRDCINLSILPRDVCGLSTLRFLQLSGCYRIDEFPDLSRMECLEELYADKTAITQLPSPNLRPKNLKTLRVGGFKTRPREDSPDPIRFSLLTYFTIKGSEGIFSLNCDDGQLKVLHMEVGWGVHERTTFGPKVMYGSSLTSGMPDWFRTKSNFMTTGLKIDPHDVSGDRNWIGYALFVEYEVLDHRPLSPGSLTGCNEDSDPFSSTIFQFFCRVETNERYFPRKDIYVRTSRFSSDGPLGFWLYIPAQWFYEHFQNLDQLSHIKTSDMNFQGNGFLRKRDIRAGLVYRRDASKFYSSIAPQGLELEFHRHLPYYLKKVSDDASPLVRIEEPARIAIKEGIVKSEAYMMRKLGGKSSARTLDHILQELASHEVMKVRTLGLFCNLLRTVLEYC